MTDEQIIKKAKDEIERIERNTTCVDIAVLSGIINLANRQKAEIKNLKQIIDEQDKEVIKLQNQIFWREYLNYQLEKIKSEAIKEFAEKLTDKISVYSKYVDVDGIVILNRIFRMIEDIEKEMTKGE